MSLLAILVMTFVLTVVWGGFLFCLVMVLRKEKQKQ